MKTSRPIRARIAPAAILHNYRLAKRQAPQAKAWAVVKANAYGHGQWRAVEALRAEADGFALLECENAVALREAGVKQPILLLEGVFSARDVRAVAEHQLTSVVHCPEQLELIVQNLPAGVPVSMYLKLNACRRDGLWRRLVHEADGERGVTEQLDNFRRMTSDWRGPVCLANSAAILRHPQTHGDWVRPGIMLYGASPFAEVTAESLGLQPAMTLETAIIGVQDVAPGDRVGYGGTFTAHKPMRIGVVACGYADGYPRHAPSGTPIAVMGKRTTTVGRVSMDMMACDLTDIPEAGIGAPVTLWGEGVGGIVPADEVATAAGTIAYELFCALAPRVPVSVVDTVATTESKASPTVNRK